MTSRIADLADAVAAEISAGVVPAVRRYVPFGRLEDLDTLRVSVAPRTAAVDFLGRRSRQITVEIDVCVQIRGDDAAFDSALTMLEDIAAFMFARELAGAAWASYVGQGIDPIFNPEHAREHGVFTGVVTLRYRVAV